MGREYRRRIYRENIKNFRKFLCRNGIVTKNIFQSKKICSELPLSGLLAVFPCAAGRIGIAILQKRLALPGLFGQGQILALRAEHPQPERPDSHWNGRRKLSQGKAD